MREQSHQVEEAWRLEGMGRGQSRGEPEARRSWRGVEQWPGSEGSVTGMNKAEETGSGLYGLCSSPPQPC